MTRATGAKGAPRATSAAGGGRPAASILAVGSELLGTTRVDTNSLYLTGELEGLGIPVVRKACSGDPWDDLLEEVRIALERAPLLVVTGGLGPTDDDRTKEVVARHFGRRLVRDEGILGKLRERFARRGFPMPKVNEKQADVIDGAVVLSNPRGSAPGYVVEEGGQIAILLPGVPNEMKGMWAEGAAPFLSQRFPAEGAVHRRILKVAGMAESAVEQKIQPVYGRFPDDRITILAATGEIQLHFTGRGTPDEAAAKLDAIEAGLVEALGDDIFGRDDETLEGVVGALLRKAGKTLAVAESCTGGTLAGRITDQPGSSDYFLGGAVTYADRAKVDLAGVRQETLDAFGAVSEATAREMAEGIRRRFGASIGFGVTGIAGPGGGTPEKPVGLVHVALADEDGTVHRRLQLPGERGIVRRWTTSVSLAMLRGHLLGSGRGYRGPWR